MTPLRYVLLIVALFSMGISAPTIRYAQALPLAIVVWRVILSWPLVAIVAGVRSERWPFARAVPAGLFLAVHWVTWVVAVQRTTIASAALLISTGALWSALLSRPVLGEPVTRRQWLGLLLALVGVAGVVTAKVGGRHSLTGDLYALAGSAAWVAYAFIGRRARQAAGFWGYTATLYLTTGLVVVAFALYQRAPLWGYSGTTWAALATLGVFPTLLGHGTLNYLLRFIGPARLGLWTLAEPVLATLLGAVFLGELPPLQVIVGGTVTLVGIGLGVSR